MGYFARKVELAERAAKHTEEMEERYANEIETCIACSRVYSPDSTFGKNIQPQKEPAVRFTNTDSVSAVLHFAEKGKTAVLNFASYKNAGGKFIEGSSAQEECLCHESFLYNVLRNFGDYYSWNMDHLNKAMYTNRAIYSPDVIFERNGHKAACDVITCASPNKMPAVRYGKFTDEENSKVLQERIKFVKDIAEENSVSTLILGAYGCGVFMQDPDEVAEIFSEVFARTSVDTIVYAVPGDDRNKYIFEKRFASK